MGRRVTREQVFGEAKLQAWIKGLSWPEVLAVYDRSGGNVMEGSGHPDLYVNVSYFGLNWAGWVELKWEDNPLAPIQQSMAEARNKITPWDSVVLRVRKKCNTKIHQLEFSVTAPGVDGEIIVDIDCARIGGYSSGEDREELCSLLCMVSTEQEKVRRRRFVEA
jgi:hypothetical protein